MNLKFRYIRADEVDVRIGRMLGTNGLRLLFYKDARVDQNILDETVGPMNWQRRHCRDNANCIVSIWDDEKKQWIEKEDTGTESNTEAQKGLASDSFKRACFNWGIGRELYTAPDTTIWNGGGKQKFDLTNGKCFDRFAVKELEVKGGSITHVVVVNKSKDDMVVFAWDKDSVPPEATKAKESQRVEEIRADAAFGKLKKQILKHYAEVLNAKQKRYFLDCFKLSDMKDINSEQCGIYVDVVKAKGLWNGNQGQDSQHTADVPTAENAGNH